MTTQIEALDRLRKLVNPAAQPTLTDSDLLAALEVSLIPDASDVWPGKPGYIANYDVYWAAAETSLLRAMRAAINPAETLTKVTSEGSTFEVTSPVTDWGSLARVWRARSWIGKAIGYGETLGLAEVKSPDSGFVPTSQGLASEVEPWTLR